MRYLFESILAISIAYAAKIVAVHVIELRMYRTLDNRIAQSIFKEHLLIKLENAPVNSYSVNCIFLRHHILYI